MLRRTFVEIDLGAVRHNLTAIKKAAGENVGILLPVKADAYGHGIIEISRYAEECCPVDMLGVASLDEGIELRNAGIGLPILVLGLIIPSEKQIEIIFDYDLIQTVAYPDLAEKISEIAVRRNREAQIQLKIDTGMGRIGCMPEEAPGIYKKISGMKNISIQGVYSHFPDADNPESEMTLRQVDKFKGIIDSIENEGCRVGFKHISNSAGLINYPASIFNMIRPGIMSYGYAVNGKKNNLDLIPSMTLKSCILFIKRMKKGSTVSYGMTYTLDKDANIATIPIGYGDGYSRFLSNKGSVLIGKKSYPVAGRVCMDQIMINIGDDEYEIGEEVVLFGKEIITASTIAGWIGTIPYEITCGISKRVPRVYIA
ncbi:MAG: alanine racemase [Spirochaetes bacterium]|jgi:alanine racemase|nr:alanine racemase [Spirochaetota bacterium]